MPSQSISLHDWMAHQGVPDVVIQRLVSMPQVSDAIRGFARTQGASEQDIASWFANPQTLLSQPITTPEVLTNLFRFPAMTTALTNPAISQQLGVSPSDITRFLSSIGAAPPSTPAAPAAGTASGGQVNPTIPAGSVNAPAPVPIGTQSSPAAGGPVNLPSQYGTLAEAFGRIGVDASLLSRGLALPGFRSLLNQLGGEMGLSSAQLQTLQQHPDQWASIRVPDAAFRQAITDPRFVKYIQSSELINGLGMTPTDIAAWLNNTGTQTPSILMQLAQAGLDLNTPLSRALPALGFTDPSVASFFQQRGVRLDSPVGAMLQAAGIDPNSPAFAAQYALDAMPSVSMPGPWSGGGYQPPGTFPETQPLNLPGLTPGVNVPAVPSIPAPPSMPALPALPTMPDTITLPPELQALFEAMTGTLNSEQAQRQSALDAFNQQVQQQEATYQANKPLLDTALANIQAVLSGQPASEGLQALVQNAFDPIRAEAARNLKQTAEEAAAARGMALTDTPIGQPYLESVRRMEEQVGGQQAQALIGMREQDAQLAQNVQSFQEQLRQQAMTNRLGVLQQMGTPEQAAQVLSNLGLGARQAALQQYATQGQQALGVGQLALQGALGSQQNALSAYQAQVQGALGQGQLGLESALGSANIGQQNANRLLQSQGQAFQQQLARQQAAIQNQMQLFGLLGDPGSIYGGGINAGTSLYGYPIQQASSLSSLLTQVPILGYPGATPGGPGATQGVGSMLGGLGALGMGAAAIFSDRRIKTDIEPVATTDAEDTVLALTPVTFRYTFDPQHQRAGFVAQDVEQVLPGSTVAEPTTGVLLLNDRQIVPHLVATVQGLLKRVQELEAKGDADAVAVSV